MTTTSVLADLVAQAREQTARRRAAVPEVELERMASKQAPPRELVAALRRPGRLALIAEMKRRTPSMGVLADSYEPAAIARRYEGADAISVLTHEGGFGGAPEHLAEVRAAASAPVVRKDFIVERYQVLEARAFGADGLLLIVAALSPDELASLLDQTRELGMEAVVEVHDADEAAIALAAGARIVGVNNRDLRDFSVDLGLSERLRAAVPAEVAFVAESGIRGAADARRLRAAGADAVLVGEALMRAPDVASKLRELQVADA